MKNLDWLMSLVLRLFTCVVQCKNTPCGIGVFADFKVIK